MDNMNFETNNNSVFPEKDYKNKGKRRTAALLAAAILFSASAGYMAGSFGTKNAVLMEANAAEETIKVAGQPLSIPEIAQIALPSVVEITTEAKVTGMYMRQSVVSGAGSGVIISADGVILTNNHVIDGASKITVTLQNGESYEGKLTGSDSRSDLALIKIDATGLQPAEIGDSDKLVVGEAVVAVGNPLGRLGGTVTNGIISAMNREITIDSETFNLLQTNAAINPGNSGGGLFNEYGQLIGIVNAKSAGSDIEGLGFAIPINIAMKVVEDLETSGFVTGRPQAGISVVEIRDLGTAMRYGVQFLGLYVAEVNEGGPADLAGMKPGDCIISAAEQEVSNLSDFRRAMNKYHAGDEFQVVVLRGGRPVTLTLILEESKPAEA